MDDDIRNRFRGTRRSYETPPRSRQPAPKPVLTVEEDEFDIYDSPPRTNQNQRNVRKQEKSNRPNQSVRNKSRNKKRSAKKFFKLLLFLILLGLIAAGGFYIYKRKFIDKPVLVEVNKTNLPDGTETPKPTGTIRLIATGENFAFESINNAAKSASGYDYLPMMSNFVPLFEKTDIRLCNQTTSGGGESFGVIGYPSFNSPTAWSTSFAKLGCNLINLGSDHINDKGQGAIDATVKTWNSTDGVLAHAGANSTAEDQNIIKYFTVKEVKFAYLSYTTKTINTNITPFGVNIYNKEFAKKQIDEARKNSSLILVSMTWGNEDQAAISGDQDKIAQELADFGADVVVGGGPHVVQPAKILDGSDGHQTLVWFSLGNFLNSQLPLNNLIGGMAVMDFDIATGRLSDPKIMPTYMHYEWTAAQKASGNVGARTNFKLFPLDLAADALAKSQNKTTIAEQTARITGIITQFAPIKVITSSDL